MNQKFQNWKFNFAAVALLAAILGVYAGAFHLRQRSEEARVVHLFKNGIEAIGQVTEVRQYVPPQGKGRYGCVFYTYTDEAGQVYSADRWISEAEFAKFKSTKQVIVLYDPKKPKSSIVKSTISEPEGSAEPRYS